MKKLKWKYSTKDKHWWIKESVPYANDGFCIANISYLNQEKKYRLHFDSHSCIYDFHKLSSAKQVAQLIFNG